MLPLQIAECIEQTQLAFSRSVRAAVATFGVNVAALAGAERSALLYGRMENSFYDMVVKDLFLYHKCPEWQD